MTTETRTSHIFETYGGFNDAWNELIACGAKPKDISFERKHEGRKDETWGPYTARMLHNKKSMGEFVKNYDKSGKTLMSFRLVAHITK